MHFYFQPTVPVSAELFFLVIHAGSVLCLPRPRPFPSGGPWEGMSVPLVRPERRAVGRRCRPRFRCCFGLPVLPRPRPRGGIFFFINPASLRFVCLVSRRFSSGVMETKVVVVVAVAVATARPRPAGSGFGRRMDFPVPKYPFVISFFKSFRQ